MKNISTVSSFIFFVLGISIISIEFFQELQNNTLWIKSELYLSVIISIIFIVIFSGLLHRYLNSKDKVLKYTMSSTLVVSLVFYFYVSLSYDYAFPNLVALNIITVLYLIPGLLLVRGFVALVRNKI